jgi:hypothetical protein
MDDNEEISVFSLRTHAFVAFSLAHAGGRPSPLVEESV